MAAWLHGMAMMGLRLLQPFPWPLFACSLCSAGGLCPQPDPELQRLLDIVAANASLEIPPLCDTCNDLLNSECPRINCPCGQRH